MTKLGREKSKRSLPGVISPQTFLFVPLNSFTFPDNWWCHIGELCKGLVLLNDVPLWIDTRDEAVWSSGAITSSNTSLFFFCFDVIAVGYFSTRSVCHIQFQVHMQVHTCTYGVTWQEGDELCLCVVMQSCANHNSCSVGGSLFSPFTKKTKKNICNGQQTF